MIKKTTSGASVDALALTFVRVVTVLISMVIYKLLAVTFSVEEYGTYASATLISTTVSSLTILGLTDAVNYFYAKERDVEKGKIYVYTIFCIQIIVGVVSAILVICLSKPIAAYFNNTSVEKFIPIVAFIPLFTNISNMLQVLFVTAKKAKIIAIRNLIIAVLKIVFITITCLTLKNMYAVMVITLVLDIGNVVYMLLYCKKNIFSIKIKNANMHLVKGILQYSIPMAVYILTNSMSKNIDKLVIGALGTSEMMGIYSIAAKELPFDILTTSFLTVLIPYITRYISEQDYKNAADIFSKYLQLTYIVTWIIAGGALVCSDELMQILYDKKYLSGLGIFCLYILVEMMKFANVSLIFSVMNRAKELLCYSGAALALNTGLNIVFFKIWGMIGPAIATVVVTLALSCVIMIRSAQLLNTHVSYLLNIKQMIYIFVECVLCSVIPLMIQYFLKDRINTLIMFIICYLLFAVPLLLINYKKILRLLKVINNSKLI